MNEDYNHSREEQPVLSEQITPPSHALKIYFRVEIYPKEQEPGGLLVPNQVPLAAFWLSAKIVV